jgi:hypothetical protein
MFWLVREEHGIFASKTFVKLDVDTPVDELWLVAQVL